MPTTEKAAAVAELAEQFRTSSGAVLTEYRGLTVQQITELRTALGDAARYAVAKNTLTRIAAREAGIESIIDLLVGPSAIAFVKGDPVVVAKSLREFARNNPALLVKGGVLDGRALSADEIRRMADLESREVLLAKLAGAAKSALTTAVSTVAAPLSQFARLAAALQQKAEAEAPAAEAEAPAAEAEPPAAEAEAPAEPAAEPAGVVSTDEPDLPPADA